MIKKSLFEQELEAGMQRELRKTASEVPDLVQAAECLHAAMEILEEAGMVRTADAVLAVLEKIAAGRNTHVQMGLPSVQKLMEAGLTQRDMQAFGRGDLLAKAKFNLVLHQLGYNEHQIANFIGKHNVMSKKDAEEVLDPNRNFGKIWEWMKNPTAPVDPSNPQPGETLSISPVPRSQLSPLPGDEISFQSMKQPGTPTPGTGDEIKFNSIAGKPHKPKRPDAIHDWHTKGLTPEKMVENLKHHGTEFNMSDDGFSDGDLDPEIADSLGVERADDMNDIDVPQGPEFEGDWKTWKDMIDKEPSTARQGHKMKEISLEDLDDASDFVITDDTLEVDEKELPQDFEDERD